MVAIPFPLTHTAYWDATRAFMILSLLACFIGIVIGVMAFIHYSSFDGFDKTFAAGILFFISCTRRRQTSTHHTVLSSNSGSFFLGPGFFVLLAMAVYTGVTVNYYGKRYGSWRFSWSYIMGWVAVVLTFFSGRNSATDRKKKTNKNTSFWHSKHADCCFSRRYLLHVCLQDARMPEKLQLPLSCWRQRLMPKPTQTNS